MTRLLDEAFAAASRLSEPEQDSLAGWILTELTSERRWKELFSNSSDRLTEMADEELDEHRRKQTRRLRPDEL